MGGIASEIDSITRQIEALNDEISNLDTSVSINASTSGVSSSSSGGGSSSNTIGGNTSSNTGPSNEDMIHSIIKQMYANMNERGGSGSSTSAARKAELSQENLRLGSMLSQYGVNAYRSTDKEALGTWYTDRAKSELLFDKYRKYIYHTGSFVGKAPLKPNERYIRAENGELVLTSDQQNDIATRLERIDTMTDKLISAPVLPLAASMVGGLSQVERSTINNITNNFKPIEVHFGDTIISSSSGDAHAIADEVKRISEKNIDQIARLVGVKW